MTEAYNLRFMAARMDALFDSLGPEPGFAEVLAAAADQSLEAKLLLDAAIVFLPSPGFPNPAQFLLPWHGAKLAGFLPNDRARPPRADPARSRYRIPGAVMERVRSFVVARARNIDTAMDRLQPRPDARRRFRLSPTWRRRVAGTGFMLDGLGIIPPVPLKNFLQGTNTLIKLAAFTRENDTVLLLSCLASALLLATWAALGWGALMIGLAALKAAPALIAGAGAFAAAHPVFATLGTLAVGAAGVLAASPPLRRACARCLPFLPPSAPPGP